MHAKSAVLLSALVVMAAVTPGGSRAQSVARRPLATADIDDIARLVMLEDRREFNPADLARILSTPHPELRRRAAQAIARINDKRGIALLRAQPLDADTAVAATVVFAVGQLRDTSTIAWFDSLLASPATPVTVATEAAAALGKIKTAAAREVLAGYLTRTASNARTAPVLGEALFSIGRSTARGDLTPILRWTKSSDDELRWRATWALFRPRDPAAVGALLEMSRDKSALVRSWAVRGLAKPQADSAGLGAAAEAMLITAARDGDRRVSTEAVRALGTYSDSVAISTLLVALESRDTWISVSAAEGLGRIRSVTTIAQLNAATAANRPCALRIVAMQSLQVFAPKDAMNAATRVVRDTVPYCRVSAFRTISAIADSGTLPALRALSDSVRNDPSPAVTSAATAAIAAVERRLSGAAGQGRGGASGRQGRPPAPPLTRTLADYRQIVERWVVPDYNGQPRPTARWETPRGPIEIELYPGDAPLAVDDFVRTMESGTIVGTQFTRVVPDFVDQQETIRAGNTLRDEVNRHRLTRANLAWATSGRDTGSPGYTLNHTPQPHNEGDFTSMGRVTRGMDAVDRLELGDRILGARMVGGSGPH